MNKNQYNQRVASLNEKLAQLKKAVQDLKKAKAEQSVILNDFIQTAKAHKEKI
ncbi:MAG: hypothetical protein MUE85_23880 [Microscillaceae bacterium]|jgi:hypothetical protein|nr:hypothetical protein [Microscillaceae bacterium]